MRQELDALHELIRGIKFQISWYIENGQENSASVRNLRQQLKILELRYALTLEGMIR